jgi:hypothetical protein
MNQDQQHVAALTPDRDPHPRAVLDLTLDPQNCAAPCQEYKLRDFVAPVSGLDLMRIWIRGWSRRMLRLRIRDPLFTLVRFDKKDQFRL